MYVGVIGASRSGMTGGIRLRTGFAMVPVLTMTCSDLSCRGICAGKLSTAGRTTGVLPTAGDANLEVLPH
jgi:hypothetical protein